MPASLSYGYYFEIIAYCLLIVKKQQTETLFTRRGGYSFNSPSV